MISKLAIQTVFEILLVVGIIYGFIKEDKLIAFEDKLAERRGNADRRTVTIPTVAHKRRKK